MNEMLTMFNAFMNDNSAQVAFVTGQAGSGKTTNLYQIDDYCVDNEINHHICAFTHKAVSILKQKITRPNAKMSTLHSFLKKKPSINEHATRHDQVSTNESFDSIDKETELLIIDEFSMVEEDEVTQILEFINSKEFKLKKILFIGDLNQLPPIKGKMLTIPENYKYHFHLTKIWRQADTNPLINTLTGFVKLIEQKSYSVTPEIKQLFQPNDSYIKGVDLVEKYIESKQSGSDDIILAYSNRSVESLNALIFQKMPVFERWSPTLRSILIPIEEKDAATVVTVDVPFGREGQMHSDIQGSDERWYPNPEFQTLLKLNSEFSEIKLSTFQQEDGEIKTYFFIHGHQTYRDVQQKVLNRALDANKTIEQKYDTSASQWVKLPENKFHELAVARRDAWKTYYVFNNIINVDYPFCVTIHKSQGSTWNNVFLKSRELYSMFQGKGDDNMMYARLMYVALSRASNKVYTD